MQKLLQSCLFSFAVGTLAVAGNTQAALITPVGVTSSALDVQSNAVLNNMINHNGLTATGVDAGTHTATFATQNHWRTTSAASAISLTFDLGAAYDLSGLHTWNYNESGTGGGGALNTNRGMQQFQVSFSFDNINYFGTQTINVGQATGLNTYAGEYNAFAGGASARYVRIANVTSYGSNNGFTGLSEIRFDRTTAEIEPISVNVNQTANGGGAFGIANLINNTGMAGVALEQAVEANSGNSYAGMWRQQATGGNVLSNAQITFDLGTSQELGSIKIWNYSELNETARGLKDIELFISDDGVNYTSIGAYVLQQALAGNQVRHDVIDLHDEGIFARYVRLNALTNYGGSNNFYGLNEVRFFAAAAPEPQSVALAISGLMGVGLLLRYRRRAA